MKKKFKLLILVFLLILSTACGSTSSNNNGSSNTGKKEDDGYKLAELQLYNKNNEYNGKYTYAYNSKGDTTRQSQYDKDNNLKEEFINSYTYLDDGRISKELSIGYSYENGVKKENLYNDKQYSWDPTGKVAYTTIHFRDFIGDTEMEAYDDEGRVIERTLSKHTYYYTYSDKEKVQKTYWHTNDTLTYDISKLDKDGNTIRREKYVVNGFIDYKKEDLVEYTVYDYDGLDYVAKTYSSSDKLMMTEKRIYDKNKRDYKYEKYDADGKMTGGSKYIYKPIEELIEER